MRIASGSSPSFRNSSASCAKRRDAGSRSSRLRRSSMRGLSAKEPQTARSQGPDGPWDRRLLPVCSGTTSLLDVDLHLAGRLAAGIVRHDVGDRVAAGEAVGMVDVGLVVAAPVAEVPEVADDDAV